MELILVVGVNLRCVGMESDKVGMTRRLGDEVVIGTTAAGGSHRGRVAGYFGIERPG
jgi:hypothetical protein